LTFITGFFLVGFLATVDFGFAFTFLVFLVAVFFAGAFSDFSIALANFSMFFSQFLELLLRRLQILFNGHSGLLSRIFIGFHFGI
jgi:hypothetical protein